MISRIVGIENPARLSLKDCQLVVDRFEAGAATVPIEDLGTLVVDHPQVSFTAPLLVHLAQNNVAVVLCDEKHLPAALLSPFEANSVHAETLRAQTEVPEPTRKRLWQEIARAKIREQAALLEQTSLTAAGAAAVRALRQLSEAVRSGDPDNCEAQAARIYFPALFGQDFQRSRFGGGVNAMLNYGYALLRAAVARAIVGAGLHPALGIHHRNRYNAFALADDALEPLRPLCDEAVYEWWAEHGEPDGLTPEMKRALLGLLAAEVIYDGKRYPISTALGYYAAMLRKCICGEARRLRCPGRIATGA